MRPAKRCVVTDSAWNDPPWRAPRPGDRGTHSPLVTAPAAGEDDEQDTQVTVGLEDT